MYHLRDEFPIVREYVYLNHAAISPTPTFALFEAFRYLYEVSQHGSLHVNKVEEGDFANLRKKMATFINAEPGEVSFVPNTSFGANMVIHGLNLGKGDVVLSDGLEFPSTVYPLYKLAQRGVNVKLVRASPEELEDRLVEEIGEGVKLVSVSHVSFNTGVTLNAKRIAEACRKVGALLLLDVIQSAGALKLDVKEMGADFVVAGGYKWMMSPQGSGFLYVRKGLVPDPPLYGWKSSSTYMEFNAEKFSIEEGPRRFEIGTIDVAANLAMASVAERLTPLRDEVERRVRELSGHAIDVAEDYGLEVITPKDRRAGIVVVKVDQPRKVAEELLARRIVVSPRGEGIRISTHFYNTEDEVDKALVAISQVRGRAR
ncbi:MAG: aminotransferase class V-fold PLP-dependent enzyme [Metallosphaera yellowstonensis]|jgi:selenocysteine lyase/cysteine desulfurase|uniref:Selenocysteine lyase n=1 Tax=Metallosphaera yellowstonensis MK1 TaxID=671065 RepID=H2C3E5_9CREN|nr:aminotransferase class V-fold PLP-dependent enzyme [Metallosphaera yellowstonensis]EHP70766.1 selenocysteine lyase [Metallosphaera yellowstonensis MK1]